MKVLPQISIPLNSLHILLFEWMWWLLLCGPIDQLLTSCEAYRVEVIALSGANAVELDQRIKFRTAH